MHTTIAFTESIAQLTNEDIAALTDQVAGIQNGHFVFQQPTGILWAAICSANMDRARLNTPQSRAVTFPFVRPLNVAALPASDPNIADYRANPLILPPFEEIALEVTTNAAGPSRVTGVFGVGRIDRPMTQGDVITMRGTSTTAAVANAWSPIVTTFADILPNALYDIVGMEVISTNAIAARLNLADQVWRPGGVSVQALGSRCHHMFRQGGLGVWGSFRPGRMPLVEVLCNAADAAHEVYVDIIKR